MAVCHALKNLGTCKSVEAAEALVKLKGEEAGSMNFVQHGGSVGWDHDAIKA